MFERTRFVDKPKTEKETQFYDLKVGEHEIKIRVSDSSKSRSNTQHDRPAIVFYHGGGWCIGSVEMYHKLAISMARQTSCIIVSVDYRRAPEHPYPIPLEDCTEATKYVFENAEQFGIDTNRVAIMGDSAGGNLAAAVALMLRDTQYKYRPKLQILIYPVTQCLDLQLPSYLDPYKLLLDPEGMAKFITHYTGLKDINCNRLTTNDHISKEAKKRYSHLVKLLPDEYRKNYSMYLTRGDPAIYEKYEQFALDPYFSPLTAESHQGLPEAYVWTAGYDLLRDEGIMYANKLKQDGVEVTWVNKPYAIHGALSFDGVSPREHRRQLFSWIRERML